MYRWDVKKYAEALNYTKLDVVKTRFTVVAGSCRSSAAGTTGLVQHLQPGVQLSVDAAGPQGGPPRRDHLSRV